MNNLIERENTNLTQTGSTNVEISRAVQEVLAAVLVAQIMPRDEARAQLRIREAAKRMSLAKQASYSYPRDKKMISGPSIRAAETLAKYWGNISYGIKELNQDLKNKTSEMLTYAWDLETNTRVERVFQVEHMRDTKYGKKSLETNRDIYEMTANLGARRLRACILEVIPSDVVEDFMAECEKTLLGDNKIPLKDRVLGMITEYEKIGISQDLIEKYIGCKVDKMLPTHFVELVKIYKTIRDGIQPKEAYFDIKKEKEIEKAENVLELKGEVVNEIDKK